MNIYSKWMVYGSAGVLIILLFLMIFLLGHRPITPKDRTLITLKHCEYLESGKSYFEGQDVSSYLHSNELAGLSLGQIFSVMKEYPQYIPENIVGNTNIPALENIPPLKDAWGNPLNLMWRSNALKSNVSDGLTKKNLPVLIWSSGPNGSNEYGRGDDVYLNFTRQP